MSDDTFTLHAVVNLGVWNSIENALRRPDLRKAFGKARKPTRGDQKDHRLKQVGSEGPWAPRAASTMAKRSSPSRRRARKLLGRLPNALILTATRQSIVARSRVKWSLAHQRGGIVGHGARLPAREFLWPSDSLLLKVARIIVAGLQETANAAATRALPRVAAGRA